MLNATTTTEILPDDYRFLQDYILNRSGIVIDADKHYLLEARLTPILRDQGLRRVADLCALLRGTASMGNDLSRQVVEAMTTNETYFFRDPAQYEVIKRELLPRLRQERASTRKLSFWSAASSTGQEAYSLAMLLREEGFVDWNLRILGTDLAEKVVSRAREGKFLQIETNRGLPVPMLIKYFRRHGLDWQLKEEIRDMVKFETFDLRRKMSSLGPFDLVFCRNVLIYFEAEARKRIIQEIHGTLFRGGWLLLGGAEAVLGVEEWFDRVTFGNAAVYVAK